MNQAMSPAMTRRINRRRGRDRKSIAGFTLIETLIATALMMAVLGALATVTAQWLPNWNRGFTRVQRSDLLALGLERIVADLSAAEVIPAHYLAKEPLFEGTELSVTLVRTAIGPNAARGLEIIRLAEMPDAGNLALVRASMPFTPLPPEGSVASYLRFRDPVVLVRAPYRVTFAYAGGADRVWRGTWSAASGLPRAVRITVRDAATHQTLSMSTATMVHAELGAECARATPPPTCEKKGATAQ
jgi:general secretion pathway protein J